MDWRRRSGRAHRSPAVRRVGMGFTRVPGRALACKPRGSLIDPAAEQTPAPFKSPVPPALEGLLDGFCPEPRPEHQLAVNVGGRLLLLRVADIDWLEAEGDCVALHVGRETHLVCDTLAAVTAKLPPGRYARISPSTLVNLRQVKGLRRLCQGEWQVLLRNGLRLAPQFVLGEAALVVAKCSRAAQDQIPSA